MLTPHQIGIIHEMNLNFPAQQRLRKLREELAELSLALCHLDDGRDVMDNVAEEMADVIIMSFAVMLHDDIMLQQAVEKWLEIKVGRVKEKYLTEKPPIRCAYENRIHNHNCPEWDVCRFGGDSGMM